MEKNISIDHKDFKKLVPQGRTASGRALWSPNTSVIEPLDIVRRLEKRLIEQGVIFIKGVLINEISPELKKVNYFKSEQKIKDINQINYGYLFNTAGVNADLIAKKFDVGMRYTLLPFKGLNWELETTAPFEIKTNLYRFRDIKITNYEKTYFSLNLHFYYNFLWAKYCFRFFF